MDPISTLNQVMLLLQQQLANKTERGKRASSERKPGVRTQQSASAAQSSVQGAIQSRLAALRAAGAREAQTSRAVVEALLLHEFGAEVTNDAAFQRMADWVHASLMEYPASREMLLTLVKDD